MKLTRVIFSLLVLLILISATALPTVTASQFIPPTSTQAEISPDLFVDDDNATGVEDGSALNPYTTIQAAIDAASSNAAIAVAAGTYAEYVRVQGKVIRLYGGYIGGTAADYDGGVGGDFDTRDSTSNVSHIQGDSQDSTVSLIEAGESVVDGFRVTGGTHSIERQPYCCWGGGFYISGGAPTIANNLIEDNNSLLSTTPDQVIVGGGIFAEYADSLILDNVIRNNIAGRGAGIAIDSGTVVIRGNTIEGNIGVSDHGGGLYIAAQTADISYNRIIGNVIGRDVGYGWGGGIIVYNQSTAMIAYNVITDNYAPSVGSGVFIDDGATAAIEHNLIYANQCTSMGGVGIYVDGAGNGGPGSTVSVNYTTVADHDCETSNGGNAVYVEQDSVVTITNSIFWENGWDDVWSDDSSEVSVTYTLSNEAIEGDGNLSADPLFADAASNDYHLRSTAGRWDPATEAWVQDSEDSPAIDAGDPSAAFDAEPETNGGRANLGAYGNTPQASLSAG